ncbi:MAG TPA: cyclic lactone autoinducer peptide [Syntrophomonadaceae bacterium]|nr:cyclic lactone autoinducer peptide [Syntrophomonadaceae bacterium]
MKRFLHRILPACCSILTLAAVVGVKPACIWWLHQPEVPVALRK